MAVYLDPAGLIGWVIAPALIFSLAYPAILTKLSVGLVSRYARADLRKRIYAALLDGFVILSVFFAFASTGRTPYLLLAAGYALLRDSINGQSPGKFILGVVVINVETGIAAGWRDSARRNLLFLLPGANVAAVFLESRALRRDPQGQRLGDRFAQTQVIEGASAAELLQDMVDRLVALSPQSGPGPRRRDRAPVSDRAAYGRPSPAPQPVPVRLPR